MMPSVLSLLVVFLIKGALQELKLFGNPGAAEVQCEDTFQVSVGVLFSNQQFFFSS